MSTIHRLTSAQYDALARAVKRPLCRLASGRWVPVGSNGRILPATVDRLLAEGFLERTRSKTGTPLAVITDAGRERLGIPRGREALFDEVRHSLHERIAP